MLPLIVLVELLLGVEVRSADAAVEFVRVCHTTSPIWAGARTSRMTRRGGRPCVRYRRISCAALLARSSPRRQAEDCELRLVH